MPIGDSYVTGECLWVPPFNVGSFSDVIKGYCKLFRFAVFFLRMGIKFLSDLKEIYIIIVVGYG